MSPWLELRIVRNPHGEIEHIQEERKNDGLEFTWRFFNDKKQESWKVQIYEKVEKSHKITNQVPCICYAVFVIIVPYLFFFLKVRNI